MITCTCILSILGNVTIYLTHFPADPGMQTDYVKMREFHINMNCERNIATLIDFKTIN